MLNEKLLLLPNKPGCYLMKDKNGVIIYVGKAKNLKNRVNQYFTKNSLYTPTERPIYGILLDMVGGRSARFYREYFSEQAAPWVNSKVWQAARTEGITRFINESRGAVTDDHLFITQAGIPCIDIIECSHPQTGTFAPTWHTMADNLESIDSATLGDVGRTLMRVIYTEKTQ